MNWCLRLFCCFPPRSATRVHQKTEDQAGHEVEEEEEEEKMKIQQDNPHLSVIKQGGWSQSM